MLGLVGSIGGLPSVGRVAIRARSQLGLQLFTVMGPLESDFEGTLRAVARIGYREVETIGSFGRDPARVRELLDRYGLVSPSQHLVPGDLYDVFSALTQGRMTNEEVHRHWLDVMSIERVKPIVEEGIARARILGQKYIVWQILWPEQMATRQLLDDFCRAMNIAGALCAREGLVFSYHNHRDEFHSINGYRPYDLILENTDARTVKFEMDVYWAIVAKADPVTYFVRYPNRYLQCHLKDGTANGHITVAGAGIVNFPAVVKAAKQAGCEHYYVEYDRADDPMGVTLQSYEFLKRFL